MQEFANRKKRTDDKKANIEAESAKYSKCKAAQSTGNKVLTFMHIFMILININRPFHRCPHDYISC